MNSLEMFEPEESLQEGTYAESYELIESVADLVADAKARVIPSPAMPPRPEVKAPRIKDFEDRFGPIR